MTKIKESPEQVAENRLKLKHILETCHYPYTKTYIMGMVQTAKNISFPAGSVEFTLNGNKYAMNRETGDFISQSDVHNLAINKIREVNFMMFFERQN